VLGVEAAWRTGVGMVRYLGAARAEDLVLARRPETVTAEGRVQAWVVGSGTDAAHRPASEDTALRRILAAAEPVVLDAGALDLAREGAAPRVITPHARELARVRRDVGLDETPADADDVQRTAAARETAERLGAAVLLKGAVTIVATPGGWVGRVSSGSSWLATAGTGDVLAGVIGAVVASAQATGPVGVEELGPLAATGAWLHGRAASLAAAALGAAGGPITALDVAAALPRTVGAVVEPA
jgi:NAD(P)H-hydrate repair Nnr-like enzyme with NAD(P)H-hydrate dehydratase domain